MNKERLFTISAASLVTSVILLFTGILFEFKYLTIGAGWAAFGQLVLFTVMWVTILIIEKDNKPKEEFKEKPEKKYTLIDFTNGTHRIIRHSMSGSDIFTFIHNLNFDSISNDFRTPERTIIGCYSNNQLVMQLMIVEEED